MSLATGSTVVSTLRKRPSKFSTTFIGNRLRLRRTTLGWSQEKLAASVGLTFQQIQKYENGQNRISADRLFEFSCVLGVPIAFFFEGIDLPLHVDPPTTIKEGLEARELLEIARAFSAIRNSATREKLLNLVKAIALDHGNRPR